MRESQSTIHTTLSVSNGNVTRRQSNSNIPVPMKPPRGPPASPRCYRTAEELTDEVLLNTNVVRPINRSISMPGLKPVIVVFKRVHW